MLGDHGDTEVLVDQVEEAVHVVDLQRDGPPYARGGEDRVRGAARGPVRVEVDEDLAAEVVRGDRRAGLREPVAGMAQHGHRLAGQRYGAELVGVRLRAVGERQVEAPGRDLLRQRARTGLAQPDLDIGMTAPERGEQTRHMHPGDALLGAQRQRAAQHALHRGHRLVRRADLCQDAFRLAEQRPPGLRERDPARGADEQRGLQLPLQGADRRRQTRLGDHQPLGRAGEVVVLGYGDEMLEMTQFHD